MKAKFKMSMVGELTFFLDFEIRQGPIGIFFSWKKYVRNSISKFGMDKAKAKRIPTVAHLKLSKDTTE